MTDNNDDKTFGGAKKTLTLKPSGVSQGTVRQDMGRGRTKAVVVETRKRRPMRPEDEKPVVPIASARLLAAEFIEVDDARASAAPPLVPRSVQHDAEQPRPKARVGAETWQSPKTRTQDSCARSSAAW